MKLGGYIRVSSEEQVDGYSIEAQKHAILGWTEANNYHVDRFFIDVKSGRNDKRPEFLKCTRWVVNGGADGLVVHKIDRFARNLMDLLAYMKQIQDTDKRFFSVSESFVSDNSPLARLFISIAGALAQFYSDNLSTEVKKGQRQKAREGKYPGGKLPFGYCRNELKEIVPHEVYGPLVSWAFRTYAQGDQTTQTIRTLAENRAAPKGMYSQTWSKILRNRFYVGQFVWGGKVYQGSHQPLIDRTTFDLVQTYMDQAVSPKNVRHFWLLKGLLWSEAEGKKMHGSMVRGKYPYYVAGKHRVKAKELESLVGLRLATVKGYSDFLPERYRLAAKVSDNMADVWQHLTEHQRQELLQHIVLPSGIRVARGGGLSELQLQDGFNCV